MALVITEPEQWRLLRYLLPASTCGGVGRPWGASSGLGWELTPACLKLRVPSDHKALSCHRKMSSVVGRFSDGLQAEPEVRVIISNQDRKAWSTAEQHSSLSLALFIIFTSVGMLRPSRSCLER